MTDKPSGASTPAPEAPTPEAPTLPEPSPKSRRRLLLRLLAIVIVGGGVAYGGWDLLHGRWHVGTDDAYVNGNVVQVAPRVAGTIVVIDADTGDLVRAGQEVVALDPNDAVVALSIAEANLASVVRKTRGLYNNERGLQEALSGAEAGIAARTATLWKAQADYQRRTGLAKTGAVSTEDLGHARDALTSAQSALSTARSSLATLTQQYEASRALVETTVLASQPDVVAAAARVRAAYLEKVRTRLVAPVTGYVAKRTAQPGQRVEPGDPLMAIIPLQTVWTDANFTEAQLGQLRIGQPVRLHADVYGRSVAYNGRVESLGVGTGSAFALLPAQNATGNWIKIVQRVPVRIVFTRPEQLVEHPLRIGLSMQTDVDVHDQSGSMLAAAPPTRPVFRTDVYASDLTAAETLIRHIIDVNSGAAADAGRP